jgi:hypothetical protein
LSIAKQEFDLEAVGAALGLGRGFTIEQTTYGAKVRLFGDAADSGDGTDFYIAASKLYLNQSLLLNGAIRFTKANQFSILGFGSACDDYSAQFEGSFACLLNRHLAIGAEVHTKPHNLAAAKEETAYRAYVAFAPNKNASLTLAYADLGNIVVGKQCSFYACLQFGFLCLASPCAKRESLSVSCSKQAVGGPCTPTSRYRCSSCTSLRLHPS